MTLAKEQKPVNGVPRTFLSRARKKLGEKMSGEQGLELTVVSFESRGKEGLEAAQQSRKLSCTPTLSQTSERYFLGPLYPSSAK